MYHTKAAPVLQEVPQILRLMNTAH